MVAARRLTGEAPTGCQRPGRGFRRPPAPRMGIVEGGAYPLANPPPGFRSGRPHRGNGRNDVARGYDARRLGPQGREGIGFQRRQPLRAVLAFGPLVFVRVTLESVKHVENTFS